MKITSDSAKFSQGRFIGSPVSICYRGTLNALAAIYSHEQIRVMVALEMTFRDMQRVSFGATMHPYELQISCTNKQEYDFIFSECLELRRLFSLTGSLKLISLDKEDAPGSHYKFKMPYDGDGEAITITVKWAIPALDGIREGVAEATKRAASVAAYA